MTPATRVRPGRRLQAVGAAWPALRLACSCAAPVIAYRFLHTITRSKASDGASLPISIAALYRER